MLCNANLAIDRKLIYLQAVNFTLVDQVISLIVFLHGAQKLSPKLSMDKRPVVSRMVKKVRTFDCIFSQSQSSLAQLFRYLHQDLAISHVRAVNLIWSMESLSRPH